MQPRTAAVFAQPALAALAFGAGCATASAAARFAAEGASTTMVWIVGLISCGALAAASFLLRRDEAAPDAATPTAGWEERAQTDGSAPDAPQSSAPAADETEREQRADQDWRSVSRGDQGLVRRGMSSGDTIWDE